MATYPAPNYQEPARSSESGNVSVKRMSITGNGAGGNAAAASVLRMGTLPANIIFLGCKIAPSATTASLTCKAGYTPVDSAVGPTADDDAFVVAGSTGIAALAGQVENNGAIGPVRLNYETYFDITTAGATLLAATVVNVDVYYEHVGPK